MESDRANYYPTLYMGSRKKGETNAATRLKLSTRAHSQLLASEENYHFCTVGSVTKQPALKYVGLDEFDSVYRSINYQSALEIVTNNDENEPGIMQQDRTNHLSVHEESIFASPKRKIASAGDTIDRKASDLGQVTVSSNQSSSRKSYPATFEPMESCLTNPEIPERAMRVKDQDERDVGDVLLKYKRMKLRLGDNTEHVFSIDDIEELVFEDI